MELLLHERGSEAIEPCETEAVKHRTT